MKLDMILLAFSMVSAACCLYYLTTQSRRIAEKKAEFWRLDLVFHMIFWFTASLVQCHSSMLLFVKILKKIVGGE
jgi:hypothetical protein